MTLTSRSDFNTFIQKIRPVIQLVAKTDSTLSVAMLRQQVDSEIRRFLPEIQNESFASFEQRLKLQFQELQTKSTSRSNAVYRPTDISTSMDLDTISAPIRRTNNYSRPASPSSFRPRSPSNFRNRNMSSSMQVISKPPNPPDKSLKTVSFSDPPTTDIKYISVSDSPDSLFASRLPFYDLPTGKLTSTPLTTMTLHLNESICFKLTATINDRTVSVLLDTGSQITSMTESTCSMLRLPTTRCEPLNLRLGDNSAGSTSDKLAIANICFGNTKFKTTFRLMTTQPYDIILGANFIVASKSSYDPSTMTISFAQGDKLDIFKMMPSGLKATEWAPLVLAASAVYCLPKADPDISAILMDVATLFDPTPRIINTDFPHQLRLTTDHPAHARMRRYSPEEARVLREHVKELYEAGYARPSKSPYSANPLIVPKADGTPRVVINFRPLNKITIRDEYPLPRIDVILNQLFGCCFYSKLDVLKVFYQIPLHPNSIEASAFSTQDGHFEFLVMPQGMSESPATFQRNIK
ncbi:Retrovirus-related Pol polyprotein from transposon [Smittium culicis]|uniref:Retrovirus-related Pol polyprotein from transposon n=1 Tax=Smittium culicis TaxID=133412 RepID=A0A1R1XDX0_9FUNG|nr:Retrovirus-related Pol polyprotein from transposon [Smittium culicis]